MKVYTRIVAEIRGCLPELLERDIKAIKEYAKMDQSSVEEVTLRPTQLGKAREGTVVY